MLNLARSIQYISKNFGYFVMKKTFKRNFLTGTGSVLSIQVNSLKNPSIFNSDLARLNNDLQKIGNDFKTAIGIIDNDIKKS